MKPKRLDWESLGERTQLRLAQQVVEKRRANWLKGFRNVFAVSAAGHRIRGRGTTFRLEREAVIRFYVTDKAPQPNVHERPAKQKRSVGDVPSTIVTSVVWRGKNMRVRIPTDVYHEAGRLHAQAAPTFYAQAPQQPEIWGSGCCLLKVDDSPWSTYLLGCHHVFCCSTLSPTLNAIPGSMVEFGPKRTTLGEAAYRGAFPSGADGYAMDAAFVDVTNYVNVLPNYFQSGRIKRLAGFIEFPNRGDRLLILTPNGDKQATYDKEEDDFPLPVATSQNGVITLKFRTLFCYTSTCQEGDSGSAVVDEQGTLYGMHIYGPDSGAATNGLNYAIHISEIIKASTVGTQNDWTLA